MSGRVRSGSTAILSACLAVALAVMWSVTRPPAPPALENGPDLWGLAAEEANSPAAVSAWLDAGWQPSGTGYDVLARQSLADLHRLLRPNGALLAGPGSRWRYVWPRDASFAAVALSASGHRNDARAVLTFLASVQRPDGGFEARYLPDGSGVPDDRPAQADGAGWVLWALREYTCVPEALPADLQRAARRAARYLFDSTAGGTRLPPPTPDYWEVPVSRTTLGSAAAHLVGLESAALVLRRLGDGSEAERLDSAARRFRDVVITTYGPRFERFGPDGGPDAGALFLLQPLTTPPPGALNGRAAYLGRARVGAGGLAPGTAWRQDEVSWTPETALAAWTSAGVGDLADARHWLAWLFDQRTAWGSVPEKVRRDGAPAGPAPVAWTAALIVMTARSLESGGRA